MGESQVWCGMSKPAFVIRPCRGCVLQLHLYDSCVVWAWRLISSLRGAEG